VKGTKIGKNHLGCPKKLVNIIIFTENENIMVKTLIVAFDSEVPLLTIPS